jgi:hypothetical protein
VLDDDLILPEHAEDVGNRGLPLFGSDLHDVYYV